MLQYAIDKTGIFRYRWMVPKAKCWPGCATGSTFTQYPYKLLRNQRIFFFGTNMKHTEWRSDSHWGKGEGFFQLQVSILRTKGGRKGSRRLRLLPFLICSREVPHKWCFVTLPQSLFAPWPAHIQSSSTCDFITCLAIRLPRSLLLKIHQKPGTTISRFASVTDGFNTCKSLMLMLSLIISILLSLVSSF